MNTASKSICEKVTLTLPQYIVVELKAIPKGQRSGLVAGAVGDALKLWKLKHALAHLREHPVHIKIRRGGWRVTKPLAL